MIGNRYMLFIFFSLSIVIVIFPNFCSSTWNFSTVGLPNDVPIWRFVVWRNRAFFALPSFTRREKKIDNELTLLEAGWPEPGHNYSIFFPPIVDTSVRVFSKSSPVINACERLSSIVGLDAEVRGRLWILDTPEEAHCPAKIVIYDLRRNDLEIARTDLSGIPKNNLKTLVIDPVVGIWGPRAYIGDPGDESIIVYSLFKRQWWRLRLVRDIGIPFFSATEIAISRKNSLLYLTDPRSQNLFSVDLEVSRNDEGPSFLTENDTAVNSTINWVGTKMGISSGLVCDHKGGLHYFLVTEHASVRWDTRHDLKTSSYSILLQNEDVPCITDYRVDIQRNVWALVNLDHPFAKTRSSIFHGKWDGKSRTVRVFRYYPLGQREYTLE